MEILLLIAACASNIVCFIVGAKVGQTVSKGEPIEAPQINPLKVAQEHREKKQAEKEQEQLEAVLRNIEVYDGTAEGQKDVPGR